MAHHPPTLPPCHDALSCESGQKKGTIHQVDDLNVTVLLEVRNSI